MTQEEYKEFDVFQKKHYSFIEDTLWKKHTSENPDYEYHFDFTYSASTMDFQNEVMSHIKRMYEYGYTDAEQYWKDVEMLDKYENIEKKVKEIYEMFNDTDKPVAIKANLKKVKHINLDEWNRMFNEESSKKRVLNELNNEILNKGINTQDNEEFTDEFFKRLLET